MAVAVAVAVALAAVDVAVWWLWLCPRVETHAQCSQAPRHKYTMRFRDPMLERRFRLAIIRNSLPFVRAAMVLMEVLFIIFISTLGTTDPFMPYFTFAAVWALCLPVCNSRGGGGGDSASVTCVSVFGCVLRCCSALLHGIIMTKVCNAQIQCA